MSTALNSVLVVEDDPKLGPLLCSFLCEQGFSASLESRGAAAVERIERERPSVVVLDLMLPDKNGFEICRDVRDRHSGGIVMLTASKSVSNELTGLELGADDYVVKPVEPRVLAARIRGLLRRIEPIPADEAPVETRTVAGLLIDYASRVASYMGFEIGLTNAEFDVLALLAERPGEVVTRDELHERVRGTEYDGLDRAIDVHVSRIRKKLRGHGFPAARLRAIRGAGYLLTNK